MHRWCKILEVLDTQVLFFMEPEHREDTPEGECLHQIIRTQGVCADIKVGGIPASDCQAVFDSLDKVAAERVVKTVEDLLEDGRKQSGSPS